jgi:hypothetical protein
MTNIYPAFFNQGEKLDLSQVHLLHYPTYLP